VDVATIDPASRRWVEQLHDDHPRHHEAVAKLHDVLRRAALHELGRRRGPLAGPEFEDLAQQCADDALMNILAKVDDFRGLSRFTTWAYKFVIFEVSTKVGRHFWCVPRGRMDVEDWSRLPDRFGLDPARESEWHDLVAALGRAVDEVLTDRQRRAFVAVVLNGIPADALTHELGTSRNAIYKTLYDARRKLRAQLVAAGHMDDDESA